MKIRFILCHPTIAALGEERQMYLASELNKLGHDAAVYGIFAGPGDKALALPQFDCPNKFFPRDDCNAPVHHSMSAALLEALSVDDADLILIKGVDYVLSANICSTISKSKIGFVIGGTSRHDLLKDCRVIFFETERQMLQYDGVAHVRILPKYIRWEFVKERKPEEIIYDIVNVGNFNFNLKAQELLFPLCLSHRVLFVGAGARLNALKELAGPYPNITFAGQVDQPTVFTLLAQSRIMVHCSRWEGYPRAVAEALAAGLPVVGLGEVLEGIVPNEYVHCWSLKDFYGNIENLLADDDRIVQLGFKSQQYMRAAASNERLKLELFSGILSTVSGSKGS